MAFRSMIISKPAKISAQNSSIKIENEEGIFTVPAEDISSLILENLQCRISGHALSLLAKNKSVAFVCDDYHLPVGILQSFQSHSTQLSRINEQISLSKPFKNRVWQKIIKQKILNQSLVLDFNGCLMSNSLKVLVNRIDSGDKANVEGYASRIYFQYLFGALFNRREENVFNACLNYGYSILRGIVARALVAYGFIPAIGIHHKNEFNNYNLADDFIEPFRPIVDLWVARNISKSSVFNQKKRYALCDLVNNDILVDGKNFSVSRAIDFVISSYVSCIASGDIDDLKLPEVLDLRLHMYE